MNRKADHHAGIIKSYIKMLPIAYHANKSMFISNTILNVIHGISFGLITLVTEYFFQVATSLDNGNKTVKDLVLALLVLSMGYVFHLIVNGVENFIEESFIEKANGILNYKMHMKLGKVDPEKYEDTNFLELVNKAKNGQEGLLWFVQTITLIITFYPAYFIFMGIFLFQENPLLILIIVLVFIPTIVTYISRVKAYKKIEADLAPLRRENEYYERCCVDREYFKETRILNVFDYFYKRYQKTLDHINELDLKINVTNNKYELANKSFTTICYIGIVFLLFVLTLERKMEISSFAAIFASIGTLFEIMEEIIFSYMGNLSQNIGAMENYVEFMNMDEMKENDHKIKDIESIQLEHVNFRYPDSDQYALKDVSLSIKVNEKIAIVGENGAGKSTLIRILTGLYSPTEGTISYNGHEKHELTKLNVMQCFTAVFQKYQKYQMVLKDNIRISKMENKPDDERIKEVCNSSDIELNKFPSGLNSMLSKEFGGIDLSGGQWQRVAIGRGLYRDSNVIILDEPTSAIDPLEETKLYNKFAEIIKYKTAVIVTHRLGLTKLVDKIIVLKNGRIVEIGSHQELMQKKGVYYELYHSQEQWYQ